MHYHRIIVYFDGASRNNPHGPAGCGWVMYEMDYNGVDSNFIASGNNYLGYHVSNNQAEYQGLYEALEYIVDNYISCHGLYIRGDSQVVINQLEGYYQVCSDNIINNYNDVLSMLNRINCAFVKLSHIDRTRNSHADELANEAIIDENWY
jgi:ribonuclease HI